MKNNKHFNSLIDPDDIETNYHKDSNNLIIGLAVLLMIAVCGFIWYVVSVLEALRYGV